MTFSYAGHSEKLQRQDMEKEENRKKDLAQIDGICKQEGGTFNSILIANTDLGLNPKKQTQYLKNDCLHFCIT